jgi:hypothetical protein
MIIAWRSKKYDDVIFFDRLICVKAGATKGALIARLEDDNCVSIFPDEAPDFLEALETWAAIVEIQSLELTQSDLPIKKEKKDA